MDLRKTSWSYIPALENDEWSIREIYSHGAYTGPVTPFGDGLLDLRETLAMMLKDCETMLYMNIRDGSEEYTIETWGEGDEV